MSEHAHVIRVTTFTAADGHFDDLVAAVRSNAGDAEDADGCFGAQVMQPTDRAGVIAAISRWRDQGALDVFLAGHESAAHSAVAPFVAAPMAATHYTSLHG